MPIKQQKIRYSFNVLFIDGKRADFTSVMKFIWHEIYLDENLLDIVFYIRLFSFIPRTNNEGVPG